MEILTCPLAKRETNEFPYVHRIFYTDSDHKCKGGGHTQGFPGTSGFIRRPRLRIDSIIRVAELLGSRFEEND